MKTKLVNSNFLLFKERRRLWLDVEPGNSKEVVLYGEGETTVDAVDLVEHLGEKMHDLNFRADEETRTLLMAMRSDPNFSRMLLENVTAVGLHFNNEELLKAVVSHPNVDDSLSYQIWQRLPKDSELYAEVMIAVLENPSLRESRALLRQELVMDKNPRVRFAFAHSSLAEDLLQYMVDHETDPAIKAAAERQLGALPELIVASRAEEQKMWGRRAKTREIVSKKK